MITIDKKASKEKWFDYDEDVKFKIRPFPISVRSLRPGANASFMELLYKQATYCLVDWSGIKSIDGEEVPYSDENKEFIFNYSEAIIQWICVQSAVINNDIINVSKKKI